MRRVLVQIHLWLGLTLGLFWALQGLTGACLVFHRDLERVVSTRPAGGSMAPIDDLLQTAVQASRGAQITRVTIPDAHSDIFEATYLDSLHHPRAILIDAATAQPLGQRDMQPVTPFAGSVGRWLLNLHMSLLSGRSGEIFVGVSGLMLLTAAITGLCSAWPPRKGWKAVYSYRRWRTRLQRLYGWHRALGLTVALIILTLALSGVWMTFEDSLRPTLARLVPHRLPYRPQGAALTGGTVIPAQQALSIAQSRLPAAQWVRITLPTVKAPVYTIRFHQQEASRAWLGRTSVVVDANTGHVESVYDPTTAPLSNRLVDAVLPLHDGEQFGAAGRVTMMLAGLSLPTLYVTAVWRWLAQRRRRKA